MSITPLNLNASSAGRAWRVGDAPRHAASLFLPPNGRPVANATRGGFSARMQAPTRHAPRARTLAGRLGIDPEMSEDQLPPGPLPMRLMLDVMNAKPRSINVTQPNPMIEVLQSVFKDAFKGLPALPKRRQRHDGQIDTFIGDDYPVAVDYEVVGNDDDGRPTEINIVEVHAEGFRIAQPDRTNEKRIEALCLAAAVTDWEADREDAATRNFEARRDEGGAA